MAVEDKTAKEKDKEYFSIRHSPNTTGDNTLAYLSGAVSIRNGKTGCDTPSWQISRQNDSHDNSHYSGNSRKLHQIYI